MPTMQCHPWQRTLAGRCSAFNTLVSPFNYSVCQEPSAPTYPSPYNAGLFSATLGSNRVINTTANLSSSGEPGFQPQLLLSCYFQTSARCCGSRREALGCPLLPKEVIFQDRKGCQGTSQGPGPRKSSSQWFASSFLCCSKQNTIPQSLKGETKGMLAPTLTLLGDLSSDAPMVPRADAGCLHRMGTTGT